MKSINERDYYTVAEVAEILDVSHSTVWRWIRAGRLPAYRVGARNLRIRQRDLYGARVRIDEGSGKGLRVEETQNAAYDAGAEPAAAGEDDDVAWKDLTPEERRKRLFRPLSEEEQKEQQALFDRVTKRREKYSIAPMTSDELVRLSRDREFWYGPDE